MFYTIALLTTLSTSTCSACPGGQCFVPFEAAPEIQTQPNAAVVRVINRDANSNSLGSGTIITNEKDRSIVLTCAHLFSDGVGSVQIRFADGKTAAARLLAIDRKWDLAALAISPTTIRPPPIATQAPKQGEWLSSCGYGPNGKFLTNRGTLQGYVRAAGTRSFETLEMTGAARQGDSGGPIFNQNGELVAVLWGSDGRTVGGTYCGRIRQFLARLLRPICPTQPPQAAPASPSVPPQNNRPSEQTDHASRERKNLAERLAQLHGGLSKFSDRFESITDRLKRIESISAKIQNLGLLGDSASTATSMAWLPAVLTALGWTAPPSLALILGLRLLGKILRRRIQKRIREKTADSKTTTGTSEASGTSETSAIRSAISTINDDYGKQLAQVYALSGRSPIGDLTLGREYDEELRKAEISNDAQIAKWAGALRQRVADRFNRIHGSTPTPADPIND